MNRAAFVAGGLALAAVVAPMVALQAAVPPLSVQQMVATGSMPKGVIRSPDGRTLYVANYGQIDRRNLGVYDASTLALQRNIDVPGIIVESAISPDGRTLYVSNFRRNSVQYLELATGRITREVNTGRHPKILVVSHDGRRLFAANWASRDVSEIDIASGTVTRTLQAGDNPRGMAISRAGKLYIANSTSDDIHVYEGATMAQSHRIPRVCRIPRHVTLSPDDSRLYISCLGAAVLAVMDTSNERIIRRVATVSGPKANDVSPDGRYVATADYNASGVTVVDTTDWSARSIEVPLMNRASGIVFAATGLRVIVTGWFDDHLYSVGIAGASPALSFARRDVLRTQRLRREYDSRSGENIAPTGRD
ncbi:MAG: YncE family protein [Polyangiales bacterium]